MTNIKEVKNFDDLRTIITSQIIKLENKQTTPAIANAIFNGVGKIIATVNTEVNHSKWVKKLDGALPLKISGAK